MPPTKATPPDTPAAVPLSARGRAEANADAGLQLPAKYRRPMLEILDDIEAAKARLAELNPLVSAEHRKKQATDERRGHVLGVRGQLLQQGQTEWMLDMEPRFNVPPPFVPDADLARAYHRQHYIIQALEDERDEYNKAEYAQALANAGVKPR